MSCFKLKKQWIKNCKKEICVPKLYLLRWWWYKCWWALEMMTEMTFWGWNHFYKGKVKVIEGKFNRIINWKNNKNNNSIVELRGNPKFLRRNLWRWQNCK